MAVFTVLEPPRGEADRVVFVKEGFSGAAVLFTVVWALWHRMWIVAALLFAVLVALNLSVNLFGLDATPVGVIEAGLSLLFGFEARRLQVVSMERAGYRIAGLIAASSQDAAELDYFAGRKPASPPITYAAYHPRTDDTLGIFGNV